jgi:bifunctional phosphoserine phosphatase/homoserine phosphotransferase
MVQPRVARQSHDILDPLSLQDVQPVVASEATIDTDPGRSARECPTLIRQLGFQTLLCNQLELDGNGCIVNYHMRMQNQKKHSVAALKSLNFHVLAAGDAYNDTAMLGEAHAGFFFCPPDHLPKEFPQFPVTKTYGELQARLAEAGDLG